MARSLLPTAAIGNGRHFHVVGYHYRYMARMEITYHVPEDQCRALTGKPGSRVHQSYSGRSWEEVMFSANLAAEAHGQAYILVTRTAPSSRAGYACGGRIWVATSPSAHHWSGHPSALLVTVAQSASRQ